MTGSGSVESQLLAVVRDDAKVACSSVGAVPVGAVAGAACHPGTALVALVRVLGFATPDLALADYRARLTAAGVHLRSGVEPDRAGCFLDASGHATILALCGNGISIGVVGATADVAAVDSWAARFPAAAVSAGQISTPSPPGICYGGWGA
jgi:hypothetical protein